MNRQFKGYVKALRWVLHSIRVGKSLSGDKLIITEDENNRLTDALRYILLAINKLEGVE